MKLSKILGRGIAAGGTIAALSAGALLSAAPATAASATAPAVATESGEAERMTGPLLRPTNAGRWFTLFAQAGRTPQFFTTPEAAYAWSAAQPDGVIATFTMPAVGKTGPVVSEATGECFEATGPTTTSWAWSPCVPGQASQEWTAVAATDSSGSPGFALSNVAYTNSRVITALDSSAEFHISLSTTPDTVYSLLGVSAVVAERETTVLTPDLSKTDTVSNGTEFTGTGEPGATIVITDKDGTVVGEATIDENGEWKAPISGLPDGPNNLTLTATFPGGKQTVLDLGPVVNVGDTESSPLMDPAIAGGAAILLLAAAITVVRTRRRIV